MVLQHDSLASRVPDGTPDHPAFDRWAERLNGTMMHHDAPFEALLYKDILSTMCS